MVTVISTCRYRLSEEEFVRPIVDIVRSQGFKCDVKDYMERFEVDSSVIICGTALKDFDYMNHIENFEWILDYDGKVLGICAGYQIVSVLYSNELEEIVKIGVYEVKVSKDNPLISGVNRCYFLHRLALKSCNDNLEPLAFQNDEVCMFKVRGKDIYCVSFHPEVLNVDIIINFLNLCSVDVRGSNKDEASEGMCTRCDRRDFKEGDNEG